MGAELVKLPITAYLKKNKRLHASAVRRSVQPALPVAAAVMLRADMDALPVF